MGFKRFSDFVFGFSHYEGLDQGRIPMEITQEHRTQIEKIIRHAKCQKDFQCYKSGFTNLCRVKDVGATASVECLEGEAAACEFALPLGSSYLCGCPVRNYLAKRLNA
jgi:hypothetical protein